MMNMELMVSMRPAPTYFFIKLIRFQDRQLYPVMILYEKDKLDVKRLCGVVVAKGLFVGDAPDAINSCVACILYSEGPMLILSVCSALETCLMLTG